MGPSIKCLILGVKKTGLKLESLALRPLAMLKQGDSKTMLVSWSA